ncbi:hypothetical protein Tco_1332838 [Tanacetum coccineum]
MFDTLLSFSSENDDKVFNPGILASNEEKSPHLLSHWGFKAFQSLSLEYEHVAMNLTLLERGKFIIRTSLTGFPAQSVRSSNADALDSLYLLVSLYRTPQSRLPH